MKIVAEFMQIVRSLGGLVRTRAQLFAIELAREKRQLASLMVYAVLALLFLLLTLVLASFALTLLFWDTEYRWWAVSGVLLFHALAAFFCLLKLRRGALAQNSFSLTKQTLAQDVEAIFKQAESPEVSLESYQMSESLSASETDHAAQVQEAAELAKLIAARLSSKGKS